MTTACGWLAGKRQPLLALTVVGLAFYGTWLIYRPAAYLVAAGLLLVELLT